MNWIELPYPPSANRMWRHVGQKVLRSREYEAWRTHAALLIKSEVRANVIEGPFAFYLHAGRPDRRRRDLDNLIKPSLDAIVLGCAVADDSNCQHIDVKWVPGITGVRVLVLPTKEAP